MVSVLGIGTRIGIGQKVSDIGIGPEKWYRPISNNHCIVYTEWKRAFNQN